jgi:hypothetical protein
MMTVAVYYFLLGKYKWFSDYLYRGFKKTLRYFSKYYTSMGCIVEGTRLLCLMQPEKTVVDAMDVRNYKRKWKVLSAGVPSLFMKVYPAFSRVKSSDYVPDNLFFTHIEPMLNNIDFSRSFADKNLYDRLIEKTVLPDIYLRKIHGAYFDRNYEEIADVDSTLQDIAANNEQVVFKYAITSQGGKNIAILDSDGDSLFHNKNRISKNWLDNNLNDNFLFQQVINQHPFYARFNHSSLNTIRVYTYRSVNDERVHVLHSILRVGKNGAFIDNISMGGKACGITPEGKLNGVVCDINGRLYQKVGEVNAKEGLSLFKYKQITDTAKKIAKKQFYSRLIGFDLCVDSEEKIRLIELNNFDVGVDILQQCNGPLFGDFTDEIIDYCRRKKKSFKYIIR